MIKCQDCKKGYGDGSEGYGNEVMPISLNLSREEWLLISPEDGILCANCIVTRASLFPHIVCINAKLIFTKDV